MLKQFRLPKLKRITCILSFSLLYGNAFSQTFTPVTVTGFNQDVIAETGTSSLTTTTMALDGITVSNKVMYTVGFRTANSFAGGGVPDNGTITNATSTYQMAAFNGNNALLLQRTQTGDLTLATPAKFAFVRLLAFTTEGSSLVNVKLNFSDGSTTNALTNYVLGDWFNGTTNLVLSGFGRCTRATPASGADAFSTNPRLYYIDVPISCADKQKLLTKINLTNVTTAGTNAPYPNAVFFAVSGSANPAVATPAITNATCTTNGSATLTLTGFTLPVTVTWNTTPVQTGLTATNLPAGNYIASVREETGCTTTVPVTVGLTNNLTMTSRTDTTICPGSSISANTTSNATNYSWTPTAGVSNPAIVNPTLTPTLTTNYTVTGTTGACTISKSFTVTVGSAVSLTVRADTIICYGASINANTVSNGATFSWSPAAGVSNPSIANPVLSPTSTTTYTITATIGTCVITRSLKITVLPQINVSAGPASTILAGSSVTLQGSGSTGTYLWTPATGLNATNILNPIATPAQTTTYNLKITNAQGCSNAANVTVTVLPYCIKPLNAFTPNKDGFNDTWFVTNGNCVKKVTALVYNRYGSKVFESLDYKNDWDGTYKNKPLPDGTYYYTLVYELLNGDVIPKKGDVTILR